MSNGIGGILGLLGIAVLLGSSRSGNGNGDDSETALDRITDYGVFRDQPFTEYHGDEQLFGGGAGTGNGKAAGFGGGFDAFAADDSLDPGGGNGGFQPAPTIYAVGTDTFNAPIYQAPSAPVTSFQDTIVASTSSQTFTTSFATTPITDQSDQFASPAPYAESTDAAEAPATDTYSDSPFAPGA